MLNLGKITTSENENKHKGTLHIVLFVIIFTFNVGISIYFVYYKYMNHWYLKKDATRVMFGTHTQTAI